MPLATLAAAFAAGFLSVLIFHQGVWAIFASAGKAPAPAWDMRPVPPLGVPQVISSAAWGGLWGIVMALLMPSLAAAVGYWPAAVGGGGVLTTLVALLIVFPMRGRAFAAGWKPAVWIFALLINGAWGFGFGLLMPYLARS